MVTTKSRMRILNGIFNPLCITIENARKPLRTAAIVVCAWWTLGPLPSGVSFKLIFHFLPLCPSNCACALRVFVQSKAHASCSSSRWVFGVDCHCARVCVCMTVSAVLAALSIWLSSAQPFATISFDFFVCFMPPHRKRCTIKFYSIVFALRKSVQRNIKLKQFIKLYRFWMAGCAALTSSSARSSPRLVRNRRMTLVPLRAFRRIVAHMIFLVFLFSFRYSNVTMRSCTQYWVICEHFLTFHFRSSTMFIVLAEHVFKRCITETDA